MTLNVLGSSQFLLRIFQKTLSVLSAGDGYQALLRAEEGKGGGEGKWRSNLSYSVAGRRWLSHSHFAMAID